MWNLVLLGLVSIVSYTPHIPTRFHVPVDGGFTPTFIFKVMPTINGSTEIELILSLTHFVVGKLSASSLVVVSVEYVIA